MATEHRLSLWTAEKCAGGKRIADVRPVDIESGWAEFALDNSDAAEIAFASDAWWIAHIRRNRVFRFDSATGQTSEWRIRRDARGFGAGQRPVVRVRCAPVHDVMRVVGPVYHRTTGGLTRYALGAVSNTVHQVIDTWILQTLAGYGVSWISRGVVESLRLFGLAWDRFTPVELTQAIADLVSHEWRLRRDGEAGYELDVVETIGVDLPEVDLSPGRNLLSLLMTRGDGRYANVIIPKGMTRGGDGERFGLEEATWVVLDVSGDVLILGARNGGAGPVQVSGQVSGLYLEAMDGTRVEIVASDIDQTVEVTDGSAFAVDDDVVIVRDAAGTRLVEIPNPAAVTESRREAVTVNYDQFRGERNYVRNPFFTDLSMAAGVKPGGLYTLEPYEHSAAQTATSTPSVGAFPAGWEIKDGDFLEFRTVESTSPLGLIRWGPWGQKQEVQADATANGSGIASVTLDAPVTLTKLFRARQYIQDSDIAANYPLHWISDDLLARVRPVNGLSMAGAMVGNYTSSLSLTADGLTPNAPFTIDGLTPGTPLYPCDLVHRANWRGLVAEYAEADENGEVTVSLTRIAGTAISGSNNDAVTIFRPEIVGRTGSWCVGVVYQDPITQQVIVAHYQGMPPVVFSAQFTVWNSSLGNISLSASFGRPTLSVYDAAGANVIETVTYPGSDTIPALGSLTVTLSVVIEPTATTEYQLRLVAGQRSSLSQYLTIVAWSTAYATYEEVALPPVVGSFGTEIYQAGAAEMLTLSEEPVSYQTTMVDLAAVDGYVAAHEGLHLGTRFRFRVPDLNISAKLRLLRYRLNVKDPTDVAVTLGTIPSKASTRTRRPAAQFLALATDGSRRADPTTLQPVVEVTGAYRSIGRWQQVDEVPDDPDILSIEEYVPE